MVMVMFITLKVLQSQSCIFFSHIDIFFCGGGRVAMKKHSTEKHSAKMALNFH